MAMRKIFGAALIALLLASVGYMFYGTAPRMWELFSTATPGETVLMVIVLTLAAIIIVCRAVVAVLSRDASRR